MKGLDEAELDGSPAQTTSGVAPSDAAAAAAMATGGQATVVKNDDQRSAESREIQSASRTEALESSVSLGEESVGHVSEPSLLSQDHDGEGAGFEGATEKHAPVETHNLETHAGGEGSFVKHGNLQTPSIASSMDLYVDSQDDADSALGEFSVISSTASLRSSVYDYVEENGRRFHRYKEGEYHLPNDETEQDRLDLQHHLMLLTLDGKLHLAPIEDMKGGLHEVLDIATGTGIWAIEFANCYPSASVLGTDLSPIQPEFVPPNCRFEVDDVEDTWLYRHQFDYIHGRALALCFRSHKVVFEQAFKALRPGGWFEIQDVALPMVPLDDTARGTALELWVHRLVEGGKALGKDFSRVPKYKGIMEELGFVDVVERHFQWPCGTWAKGAKMKTLGAWMREDMLAGIQGGSMGVMVKGLGMTVEEVELFLVDVRKDIKSNKIHSYFPIHVVYGRKPE